MNPKEPQWYTRLSAGPHPQEPRPTEDQILTIQKKVTKVNRQRWIWRSSATVVIIALSFFAFFTWFPMEGIKLTNDSVKSGQSSTYGTPVPIKHLKWGMNKEEAMQALKLSEKDLTKLDTEGLAHLDVFKFNDQMTLFDHPAEVSLTFSYNALIGITAQFKSEDVADVEQAVAKKRGAGAYDLNSKNEKAGITWADDTLDKHPAWKTAVEKIYTDLGMKVSDDLMTDGVSVGQKPITSWRLTIDKNDPRYGNMNFNGDIASMLNYPEKYTPELILK